MVRGLSIFRERFKSFEGAFVLIGGAACHEWFAAEGLEFRATKDFDMVLVIEVLRPEFVAALRSFIAEGGYEIRQRTQDGQPILYRFSKPKNPDFPAMLELFSRKPDLIDLGEGQEIVPILVGDAVHSLSAILLNEDYYALIQTNHDVRDGLAVASATALIPLKANAWMNLTQRKANGETVDSKDIDKHRNDVFRLAATLPGQAGPVLPPAILSDLKRFLDNFPVDSPQWPAILASLESVFGKGIRAVDLRAALATYFQIG